MHTKLDLYGIWAITGSLTTLQEVLAQVKHVNQLWQTLCNSYGFQTDALVPRFSVCTILFELSSFLIAYNSHYYHASSTRSLR